MAEKVLIYAGTTEGRLLAQELSRAHIACDVHVATEYGQMVMPELAGVKVCVGRLDVEEMRALLKKKGQNNYAAVVDATHPFATEVSANIRESTKGSGIPYLRLQRRMDDGICSIPENEGMKERAGTVHVFADYESCVQALTDTSGNILLTTGSKELAVFAPLKERLFVRVLPGLESIGLCEKAGIRGKQILAMQGPFSEEMNLAMILGLFPAFMSMVAVYFILKAVGLTEGSGLRIALILIYSAGSGVGFYIAKGFFDTVPKSLSEAAILDGCNQFQVFYKIILPLSKPIVVYTILTAFLAPWLDFVFVRVIVGPKDKYWTVSLLLYNMLEKEFVNGWFTRWAAAAVIVSIPISILFVFMQKFYVDGLTGAVKG